LAWFFARQLMTNTALPAPVGKCGGL